MGKLDKLLIEIEALAGIPNASDRDSSLKFIRNCNFNKAYPRTPGKCRRCQKNVPPGRSVWCSDVCSIETNIRCNPGSASAYIKHRDKGVCAVCKTDVTLLMKEHRSKVGELLKKKNIPNNRKDVEYWDFIPGIKSLNDELRGKGFDPGKRLWQVDHIVPVVQGGAHCSLDNLQTLCTSCHKEKTAKLAFDRAAARKK